MQMLTLKYLPARNIRPTHAMGMETARIFYPMDNIGGVAEASGSSLFTSVALQQLSAALHFLPVGLQ